MNKYDNTPKPVEKIELSESKLKLRFIFFIVALIVIIVSAIIIVVSFSTEEDGWTEIEASPVTNQMSDDDFVLMYDLGNTKDNPTYEAKEISSIYTTSLEYAYLLFDKYQKYENINNIAHINENINVDIKVDTLLYDSLKQVKDTNEILLYLAPIYQYYDNYLVSTDDDYLITADPLSNNEVKNLFLEICEYIKDDNHIDLILKDNNMINLKVSSEYISYLSDNAFNYFIDFGWIKNAFIIDYVSSSLIDSGYINGNISSYDGFHVNLDTSGDYNYFISLIDIAQDSPSEVAKGLKTGNISTVQLRGFAYYQANIYSYCKVNDETRHYYIDYNDGLCKNSLNTLTGYSIDLSCSEIALKIYDLFICESFAYKKIDSIELVWVENNVIKYSDKDLELFNLYELGDTKFIGECVND